MRAAVIARAFVAAFGVGYFGAASLDYPDPLSVAPLLALGCAALVVASWEALR